MNAVPIEELTWPPTESSASHAASISSTNTEDAWTRSWILAPTRGAPEPQLEATDSLLVELVNQGEQSGRYQPADLETQRTYDSVTGAWSTMLWPRSDG